MLAPVADYTYSVRRKVQHVPIQIQNRSNLFSQAPPTPVEGDDDPGADPPADPPADRPADRPAEPPGPHAALERSVDAVRARFGDGAVGPASGRVGRSGAVRENGRP